MNPAARVIKAFGGPAKLAEILGRDPSRIYRWTYPEERGGTGGAIPGGGKTIKKILTAAEDRGIKLSAADCVDDSEDEAKPRRSRFRRSALAAA